MKQIICFLALLITFTVVSPDASGQRLLNKMKKKLGQEADKAIDKSLGLENEEDTKTNNGVSTPSNNSSGSTGGAFNTSSGSGENAEVNPNTGRKKLKPPDVKGNINDAQSSYGDKYYKDARFFIEQALLGVEVEIGYEILNSLPENVKSLDFNVEYDQVYSSGYGFMGLDIKRSYFSNDKEAEVSILSSGLLASPLMMSGGYSEGQKPIRLKGNEGRIEAKEDGSFFIGVKIGQETIFTLDLMNFKDEDEAMTFAETFDLANVKSKLGEQ